MTEVEAKKQCTRCKRWFPYSTDYFPVKGVGLSNVCKPCNYARVKEWRERPENKPKRAAEAQRYRERHPDVREAIVQRHRENNLDRIRELDKERQKKRRQADPEGARRRTAAFKARKEAALVAIAGRPRPTECELCGGAGGTVFDHCHQQGHFRGWLCDRCNRMLGSVKDDPDLLRKMATYLEQANGEAEQQSQKEVENLDVRDS